MAPVKGNPASLTCWNCRRVTVTMWIKSGLYFPIAFDKAPYERL